MRGQGDHTRGSVFGVVVGLLLPCAIAQAAGVDPTDVAPLAELVGGLLAVPIARLVAALCVTLAVLALARGRSGLCLFLVMLAGVVLVAPAIVKAVVWRVAATVQG
jgi:type IV secretory pathway VirB2 component (pilin)